MTKSQYDIAVLGAGPAGSSAALQAAKLKRSVCLVDRNARIGVPVRCGEGIGYQSFIRHAGNWPEWTLNRIRQSMLVSPSGIKVTIGDVDESYILDREAMDGGLAAEAARAGAEFFLSTPIIEVRRIAERTYECRSTNRTFTASCVIIADGVESRLARFLGWNTALSLSDVESCAFCRITSNLIDQNTCVFYTGKSVAPGGYAWIFPRGKGDVNVGLGIIGTQSGPGKARQYLERFIDREFPAAHVRGLHCGGVPVGRWVRPLVRDGAMLAGDAARQVNSISGAGIHYSLYAGKLAGTVAAEAFSADGSIDYQTLSRYETEWKKTYGKQQDRSYSLKEFVIKTDDAFLDRIAASLAKEPSARLNYLRIFMRTFAGRPLLLYKAMKLFR
jgi:digeranylgeranylglycerophospholipid reductase